MKIVAEFCRVSRPPVYHRSFSLPEPKVANNSGLIPAEGAAVAGRDPSRKPVTGIDARRQISLDVICPSGKGGDLSELFAHRYRVYCLERGYMCPSNYPNGLESDAFDRRAAHFAAKNSDGILIGTARLVLGNASQRFPYEGHCEVFRDFTPPGRGLAAEVSRLAVSKVAGYRAGLAGSSSEVRRNHDLATVRSIYRRMYLYSRENGIRYWYAAMEKSLARLLARCGFVFTKIGPEQDYYGPVSPYIGDLRKIEERLRSIDPALLRWFQHAS